MNYTAARFQRLAIDRLLLWALALILAAGFAMPSHAAPGDVGAIVVKVRDDDLSGALQRQFQDALGVQYSVTGQTRDGAFRLELARRMPFSEAQPALNRVRRVFEVLYASLADVESPPQAKATLLPPHNEPVGQIIVKFRDQATSDASLRGEPLGASQVQLISQLAGQPVTEFRPMSGGAYVLKLFQQLPDEQARLMTAFLEANPAIEYAEPDTRMVALFVPNDPNYSSQWHYMTPAQSAGGANLPPAWDITTGSAAIRIAVLDTGILPHPDLVGRYSGGYDMISDATNARDGDGRDSDPTDPGDYTTVVNECGAGSGGPYNSSWHGTHVSGTIGAATNNAVGVAGINWVSQILPVRVLGKCGGSVSDIADAMRWAVGLSVPNVPVNNPTPARVISLSLGGTGACGSTFQNAINAALATGAVFAIAAGNSNADATGFSPGNCAGVITVSAIGPTGARAYYSNFGSPTVEIAAPGGDQSLGTTSGVLSTLNAGATTAGAYIYQYYQGTSMATPHVAGIVSLMLSANPAQTPAQVLANLQSSARAFPTGTIRDCTANPGAVTSTVKYCGAGIIDAAAAVLASGGGGGGAVTTTSLSSTANPSVFGNLVSFNVTINGGNSPTGTVNFKDGANSIAGCNNKPVIGAQALCSTSALTVGVHSLTAVYSGDLNNQGSTSPVLNQTVNAALSPTSTAVVSSQNPANAGVNVTFTATVTASVLLSGSGLVNFKDGANSIPGCAAQPLTIVKVHGTATCTTNVLTAGSHSITAVFSGDSANAGSTSPVLTQTINGAGPAVTTTAVVGVPNPSVVGQSVTFTATISGGNSPTGTVNFKDGASSILNCNLQAVAGAQATCITSGLGQGSHNITAVYSGDANNLGSTSPIAVQTVNGAGPVPTTTAVGGVPNPSTVGANVTFTATISGGNSPTGTVNFKDGANSITNCNLQAVAGAQATCITNVLTQGSHNITAVYSGDANNQGSTSPITVQTVNAGGGGAPTATAIASSLNPSTFGMSVTFTATITLGSSPTGTVDFRDGASSIPGCNAQAVVVLKTMRTATCTTSGLSTGTHNITANYSGDAGNQASSSSPLSQAVNSAGAVSTTTSVISSQPTAPFGASVTFTATVIGASPSGFVNFKDGAVSIGGCNAKPVAAGQAQCTTNLLAVGKHAITASYGGDANNLPSTSPTIGQVIQ